MNFKEFEEQLMSLLKCAHDSELDRSAVVGCLELSKLVWVLPDFFAMEEAIRNRREEEG